MILFYSQLVLVVVISLVVIFNNVVVCDDSYYDADLEYGVGDKVNEGDDDAYYYYYDDESSSPVALEEGEDVVKEAISSDKVHDNGMLGHSFSTKPRFQLGAIMPEISFEIAMPIVNKISLNRTQYMFSCRMERKGRISQLQELRQQLKQHSDVISNNDVLKTKLLAAQKTDIVLAQWTATEAQTLSEKLGSKGMTAEQRKALAEKGTTTSKTGSTPDADDKSLGKGTKSANQPNRAVGDVKFSSAADGAKPRAAAGERNDEDSDEQEGLSVLKAAKEAKLRKLSAARGKVTVTQDASILQANQVVIKYDLGPDCAGYFCQSCKLLLREALLELYTVHTMMTNAFLDDIINAKFCQSPSLRAKYAPIFGFLCETYFLNPRMIYETVFLEGIFNFTTANGLTAATDLQAISQQTISTCLLLGACPLRSLQVDFVPTRREESEWTYQCFICQAYASQLEERVALAATITEKAITNLIQDVCPSLMLSSENDQICRSIYDGRIRSRTVQYMTKILADGIKKGIQGEKKFADGLCEEIKYCTRWEDPYEKMLRTMDMVYN